MEQRELKYKMYVAGRSKESLVYFENWLYKGDVEYDPTNELLAKLFEFSYNKKDSLYEFKHLIRSYADLEEYNFYSAKSLINEIVENIMCVDATLSQLYDLLLGYSGSIAQLSYYDEFLYEGGAFYYKDELLKDAKGILEKMNEFEAEGNFRLDEFEKRY